MSLMDRIKVKSFLDFTQQEKLSLITKVQALRVTSLEEARIKKSRGRTKSAIKNLRKRGTNIDPKADAMKALSKLSPSQLKKLQELYS